MLRSPFAVVSVLGPNCFYIFYPCAQEQGQKPDCIHHKTSKQAPLPMIHAPSILYESAETNLPRPSSCPRVRNTSVPSFLHRRASKAKDCHCSSKRRQNASAFCLRPKCCTVCWQIIHQLIGRQVGWGKLPRTVAAGGQLNVLLDLVRTTKSFLEI